MFSDAQGAFLDVTLPLHQLAGHRTLLSYKPASDADAALISISGGVSQSPAALVQMLGVLRVDGSDRATATRSLALGSEHAWRLELLLPDGSQRAIDNRVIVGNEVAL